MRVVAWLFVMGLLLLACGGGNSSTGGTTQAEVTKAAAEALTQGVNIEGGTVKDGALPAASASSVVVTPDSQLLTLKPSEAAIMSLDIDNPDEDTDAVAATLVQFEDSDSHIEVPGGVKAADAGTSDAGSGAQGKVTLNLTPDKGVCQNVCKKSIDLKMFLAVTLKSKKVSQHATRDFTLDCSADGDATKCATSDAGVKKTTTKTDAGTKTTDAGAKVDMTSIGYKLGVAYNSVNNAVCTCDGSPTNAYCSSAAFSETEVNCIVATVNKATASDVTLKANCDIAALKTLANMCTGTTMCQNCIKNAKALVSDALAGESAMCKSAKALPDLEGTCMFTLPAPDAGMGGAGGGRAGAGGSGSGSGGTGGAAP